MEDILIPIVVCFLLPVAIVWIVMRAKQNATNRKSEVMLKAIEAGVPLDMEQFNPAKKSVKTIKQDLLDKLSGASITSLIGVALLILGILKNCVPALDYSDFFLAGSFMPAGCILLAVGAGLFISYFVGKKMLAKEIEAEEKNLQQ